MKIKINYLENISSYYKTIINKTIKHIQNRVILPDGLLSVTFLNSLEIRNINSIYRKKDYSTDVLTFPLFEEDIIGDIYISINDVKQKASEHKLPFNYQLIMTIAHSFAHLVGYEHDNDDNRKIMEDYEDFLLKNNEIF
jgi:probable rRNA maturation factor